MSEMRLYDTAGQRLYLNAEERAAFLAEARKQPARDRTLCETLHFTGCRPSELIEITPARIVYRTVPVPPEYLDMLSLAHGLRGDCCVNRFGPKLCWGASIDYVASKSLAIN